MRVCSLRASIHLLGNPFPRTLLSAWPVLDRAMKASTAGLRPSGACQIGSDLSASSSRMALILSSPPGLTQAPEFSRVTISDEQCGWTDWFLYRNTLPSLSSYYSSHEAQVPIHPHSPRLRPGILRAQLGLCSSEASGPTQCAERVSVELLPHRVSHVPPEAMFLGIGPSKVAASRCLFLKYTSCLREAPTKGKCVSGVPAPSS